MAAPKPAANPVDSRGPSPRATLLVALSLAAFCLLAAALSTGLVGRTSDEGNYVNAGRAILVEGGWNHLFTRAHGPLPFYATQLFLWGEPLGELTPELLMRARLGMLPFAALLLAVVFGWSTRAHGRAGGLLALALCALNPMVVGYSGLTTVDVAHAAFVTLAGWGLWEHGRTRHPGTAVLAGVGLGLALGTKYLALLVAPSVGLLALLAGAGSLGARARHRSPARPLLAGLGSLLLVAVTAGITLHAAYLFRSGFATLPPEAYYSELIPALVAHPLTHPLTLVLPQDFLLGAAYQIEQGEGGWIPYVDGRFSATGHWDFHLRGLLYKTPELLLLLLALGLALRPWRVLGGPRMNPASVSEPPRTQRRRGERALVVVALGLLVPPFVFMSGFTNSQFGIRYVLYAYPLLAVIAGGLANEERWTRLAPRRRTLVAALGTLLVVAQVLPQWPDLISFYNGIAGGRVRGWQHFRLSNSEWDQLRRTGFETLREQYGPGLIELGDADGPRFGRVAIYLPSLVPQDPEDPARTWHWLHAFEPADHLRAAWWVFDVTPETFANAAEQDPRQAAAHALALLGADELEAASRVLERLADDPRAAPLAELLDTLEAQRAASAADLGAEPTAALARDLAQRWLDVGRPDLTVAVLAAHGGELDLALHVRALYLSGEFEALNALLEDRPELAHDTGLVLTLSESYRHSRRHDDAIELLEAHLEQVAPALEPVVRERLEFFLRRRDAVEALEPVLR